jgi:hypothetical protein
MVNALERIERKHVQQMEICDCFRNVLLLLRPLLLQDQRFGCIFRTALVLCNVSRSSVPASIPAHPSFRSLLRFVMNSVFFVGIIGTITGFSRAHCCADTYCTGESPPFPSVIFDCQRMQEVCRPSLSPSLPPSLSCQV